MAAKKKYDRTKQKETLVKVLEYIKHYRAILVFSLILAAVTVACTLYLPILTGDAINLILSPGQVDFNGIKPILYKGAAVIVIGAAAQWIMNICNNRITYAVVRDIRQEAFEKIERLPLKYIDSHPYGDIVSRIIADADQFSDGLLMGFTQLFSGVLTIAGTLIFMLTINIPMTAAVVVLTPISFFVAGFIAKKTFHLFKKQSETRGEQTTLIDEMINNQKVVKAFGQEEKVMDRFNEVNERLRDCSVKATFFSSITNPATRFVNSLVYAAVAVFGSFFSIGGGINVGQLYSFLNYANQYTKPFNSISSVVTELQNALACAGRIFHFLDEEPVPENAADAKTLDQVEGRVRFEDVSFSYASEVPLIEHMNLEVKPGQRVAIVGPTGCGKTTVINLLMRFYDVNKGKITLDGVPIQDLTWESLRSSYGMVLQETWLKAGTIRDNISYGKPDATREEVIEAAKQAHAHSFIKRLPKGYDTVMGEDGGSLSQGQKQLLCIARLMLLKPPVLILDEATSSIDTMTEIRIQKAFQKLVEGRTSFVVAHRLSTIKESDVILVMKDGHILETGKHEELLEKKGFYAQLYQSQFCNV